MRELTYLEAINEALREEMERDAGVMVLGEDVGRYGGVFGVTKGLWEQFGSDRVMDTPISESGFMGAAIGAALEGFRPVVEIMFADFVTVAFDQICGVAAKTRHIHGGAASVPMVVRMPYGINVALQGYGSIGPFHAQSNEAWFCHCAGLKVVMPSTPADAKGLLKSSIRDNNPVMFYEHKGLYRRISGPVPEGDILVPIGKADIKRPGTDVTVIATGMMVGWSLNVAEAFAKDGISVEVLDPRTLVPLDKESIISSVKKTGRVVIVHEAPLTGGYGAEIAAIVGDEGFRYLKAPIKRVAALDSPIPANASVRKVVMPNEEQIADAIRTVMG